jgi:hypothetical protein
MELIRAALVGFRFAKVGQYVLEAPAGIPELPPEVEVLRLAADKINPLIELDPPRTFPCGAITLRLWHPGCGSVA